MVITNNGDKTQPLIVKKNKPKVTGVFIVAEGAENKVTEYRIKKAVINLFNIPDNKVNVYPMKK
ncbi:stage III sporulation protein AG [Clostridium tetanomorphum]|nr:stage III sporulation protein AG [Clostridium tetanomorphum]